MLKTCVMLNDGGAAVPGPCWTSDISSPVHFGHLTHAGALAGHLQMNPAPGTALIT